MTWQPGERQSIFKVYSRQVSATETETVVSQSFARCPRDICHVCSVITV